MGMFFLVIRPASEASLAACTGFSGLFFPAAISIGNLLPIDFVILFSNLPFVGGLGFLGARCLPTLLALIELE